MFHLTDTRLHTPCEMPYQREHLTVNQGVTGSSPVGGAIFVVRKSYKTEKAQDIVVLCFFVVYILCFCCWTKSLNSGAAFCPIFQKTGLELTTSF